MAWAPLQRLVEGDAVLNHTGEDIVGGPVEDAADFQNVVGGHALAQGTEDRDAPAHAGLKEVDRLVLRRQRQKPASVGGHQLLVGGHYAFARFQGPLSEVQSGAHAADGLHHHVDLGVLFDDGELLDEAGSKGAVGEIPHV